MGRNGLVALRLVLLCMIALLKHGSREALLLAEAILSYPRRRALVFRGSCESIFFYVCLYSRMMETGGRMVEER